MGQVAWAILAAVVTFILCIIFFPYLGVELSPWGVALAILVGIVTYFGRGRRV